MNIDVFQDTETKMWKPGKSSIAKKNGEKPQRVQNMQIPSALKGQCRYFDQGVQI